MAEIPGMPNREWWDQVESAYHEICEMLTTGVNTEERSNRTSRPTIVIVPTGNYACKLSSRHEVLKCVAFGTLRIDLFLEVAWQNITRAQEQGSKVKAYEVSEKSSLLSLSGLMFCFHYIQSPELVRSYPSIVDVPRSIQAELRPSADEAVEIIRDLKLLVDHTEKYPFFSQMYYILRAWMISSGLYQIDRGGLSLRLSRDRIACFDGELLRELSWSILLNAENSTTDHGVSVMIADYLLRHRSCLQSLTKDGCSFYYDSKGTFSRHWSDSQFRVVHEEFQILYAGLTGEKDKILAGALTVDRLYETLQPLFSRPLPEKLLSQSAIRVTLQYSGQSILAGTAMMQFVEERTWELTQEISKPARLLRYLRDFPNIVVALEKSIEGLKVRPWPNRLVYTHAKEDDHPYEGYWLIGVTINGAETRTEVDSVMSNWSDKISASHRFSGSAMVVHADLISRGEMILQDLKEDCREWPLPLAQPDPRYAIDHVAKEASDRTAIPIPIDRSQSPRKLRPAMDILSRLKHDPSFNLDDYVVGYTDRHSGIQEKAAGMWVSESTDEEWIPQGRIQYFKRFSDQERVWDRATKYDCIFR